MASTSSTTNKIIGIALGLAVLGVTVYVVSLSWKKGQA